MNVNRAFRLLIVAALAPGILLGGPGDARGADAPQVEVDVEVHFGPFPRLATTPEELAETKASPDFEQVREAAIAKAQPLLDEPIEVPTAWGNWIFYYANLETGGPLETVSPTEHRDPATGEIFTDQQIVEAYRSILHDRVNKAALDLGWAYAYTGDDHYAVEVKRILTIYANVYDDFPARRDRWGREGPTARLGGRGYSQSLDETIGIIDLCKAYDLTRQSPVWTEPAIEHVEQHFFRPTVETLEFTTWAHNHQTWYNAGLMCLGSVLEDAELVERTLHRHRGFFHQLEHNIDEDGMWHEGTMAYHNYALQALIVTVDAGRRMGLALHADPRFRSMIDAPLRISYPDGRLPAINDSDPMHISSFGHAFRWAYETYGDARYAHAYALGDPQRLAELLGEAPAEGSAEPVLETRSLDLAGVGLMVLRRGAGPDAVTVMLDYGKHGAAHGHYDKMHLIIFANGREWLFDPGRLTYSHAEHNTWYVQTAAHNTVTLGGRSQQADDGERLFMEVNDRFAACGGESRGAYPGSVLRRYLLVTEQLVVDVFEVEAEAPTQIDWLARAAVPELRLLSDAGEPTDDVAMGDRDGYQHYTDATAWHPAGPSVWEFYQQDDQRLRMWLAGSEDEQFIRATGFGYHTRELVPTLIRRVQSDRATFATVYDLTADASYVQDAAFDPATGAVRVTSTDAEMTVRFHREGVEARLSP